MTGPQTRFGVVSLAALDLRRRPDHRSEMRSQLLLGEVVRVIATTHNGEWQQVENTSDGYRGWVRSWGFVPCTRMRAKRWRSRARGRVTEPYAEVRTAMHDGALVSPVFWNSLLIVGSPRRGYRTAELPDGRRGFITASAVRTRPGPGIRLEDRIRSLLGIPYLWGGRTPLGFDCSAFAQQLLGEQLVSLPRDAKDQFAACNRIPAAAARLGDLVFFGALRTAPAHVGIILGEGYYVHARGRVQLNSLKPDNQMCDKALLNQLRGYGRPHSGAIEQVRGGSRSRKSA